MEAISPDIAKIEPAYDVLSFAVRGASRTRHRSKIESFAAIIAKQLEKAEDWDQAEIALRLIDSLTPDHIRLIAFVSNAPTCSEPFDGLKVFCTNESDSKKHTKGIPPIDCSLLFPKSQEWMIKFLVSELISNGLVKDEGIGRYGTEGQTYFVLTGLSYWLMDWIDQFDKNPREP